MSGGEQQQSNSTHGQQVTCLPAQHTLHWYVNRVPSSSAHCCCCPPPRWTAPGLAFFCLSCCPTHTKRAITLERTPFLIFFQLTLGPSRSGPLPLLLALLEFLAPRGCRRNGQAAVEMQWREGSVTSSKRRKSVRGRCICFSAPGGHRLFLISFEFSLSLEGVRSSPR